jgi:uncharacterized protein YebE (UPF0316 family)
MFELLGSSPYLLPLVIFLAEMTVVTFSTIRIIVVSRGRKVLAALLGSVEILLWLYAIGQIMQNLDRLSCFLAFAAGFMAGNYLGILVEQKLALGHLLVRVVTRQSADGLIGALRSANYGVTVVPGHGATGPVQILFTVIKRKNLNDVIEIVQAHAPQAFFTVDELQSTAAGVFPQVRREPRTQPVFNSTHLSGVAEPALVLEPATPPAA